MGDRRRVPRRHRDKVRFSGDAGRTARGARRPARNHQTGASLRRAGGTTAAKRPRAEHRAKASLVGFFAVDSWTEAIEREFPIHGRFRPRPNGGPPRFGVFTYHLVRALNAGRARTFRDLARIVSLDIASSGSIAQSPPPYFDGDLDLTLQGGEAGFAARFPATLDDGKLVIDAGDLHGFDADSTVAVFDGPLEDAKRIGSARIQSSEAARATAEIDGALETSSSLWVSVEAPAVALRYRVGAVPKDDGERTRLMTLLNQALSKDQLGQTIDVVETGERDIDLRLANGSLWLTPEGRTFDTNPNSHERSFSIRVDGRSQENVAADLRRSLFALARAANLVRIASAAHLAGGVNDDLQISLEVFRDSDPAQTANAKRNCSVLSQPAPSLVMKGGDSTAVSHCDWVRVLVTNMSERDMFLGVFYLTPTGGVALPEAKWRQDGCVAYMPAKSTNNLSLLTPIETWTPAARHTLAFIVCSYSRCRARRRRASAYAIFYNRYGVGAPGSRGVAQAGRAKRVH